MLYVLAFIGAMFVFWCLGKGLERVDPSLRDDPWYHGGGGPAGV